MDLFVRTRSMLRERPLSQMGADILARARAGFRRGATAGPGGWLGARIKAILLAPRAEWQRIAQEHTDIAELYLRYILPLAAIPPLCKLIGWSLLYSYIGFGIALIAALTAYVLSLVGIAVLALIAARLAPRFDGEPDIGPAFKLIAYAATPGWIGGIFRLAPGLAVLSVLMSLYSIYLIYTGAQAMLAVPEDRALGYTATVVFVAILVLVATAVIITGLAGIRAIGMV
ncbi:MAG TPA: Yip1 family protein [Stellaceae bacterium]|nr:Yip1 family protein [Stellaceae bacterium]